MEKIRVLQVVPEIEGGGVERVVYNYISFMDRNKFDFDIAAISNAKENQYLENSYKKLGVRIYILPKNLLCRLFLFYKLIRDNDYQVVHCHGIFSPVYYLFIAKILSIKIRISHSHVALPKSNFKVIMARFFLKILTTKKLSCGYAAARYLYGIKELSDNKVIVLNNAIDIEKFRLSNKIRMEYRRKLDVEEKFVIGCIARFTEQKNHKFLIDIFSSILSVKSNAVLLLIGDGELENQVKERAKKLELLNSIFFLGLRDDVSNILQALDLFLLPSLYEGFSVAMVEAQVSGLPIVTSTNVSSEIDLTNNILFISLADSADSWAEQILRYVKGKSHRIDNALLITNKGYNISVQAKILERIYSENTI